MSQFDDIAEILEQGDISVEDMQGLFPEPTLEQREQATLDADNFLGNNNLSRENISKEGFRDMILYFVNVNDPDSISSQSLVIPLLNQVGHIELGDASI